MEEIVLRIHGGKQTLNWRQEAVNLTMPPLIIEPSANPQDYGQRLYDTCLRGTVFEQALQTAAPVLFRVYDEHHHHWELIHDGTQYLAVNQVSLCRMPTPDFTTDSLAIDRPPLRILVTLVGPTSNSDKTQLNDLESLFQRLWKNSAGMVDVTILRNPSWVRWLRALDDATQEGRPYHLWHYTGEAADQQTLQLNGSTVTVEQINTLVIGNTPLKGIVLDFQGQHQQAENFSQLLTPFVMVSPKPAPKATNVLFFQFFYEALLTDGLAKAVLNARRKLYSYTGDLQSALTTAIYSRTIDDELIPIPKPKDELARMLLRNQVFVSYSHQDDMWCQRLMRYLEPLRQNHVINAWLDKDIEVGSDWFSAIQKGLAQAKVAVLLASPDFFQSKFIQTHELPYILEQHKQGNCTIVWVAVSSHLYELTPLAAIQSAHSPDEPLDRLSSTAADDVLIKIVRLVAAALKEG